MRAVLSLGSNMGDRVHNLLAAINTLEDMCIVERVSSLYETSPVSDIEQDDFLNIACVVSFDAMPEQFLQRLHEIEAALGRTREIHWGPRIIDIDIVDIDGFTSDADSLHVPHRQATKRKFVLLPSTEIAPSWNLNGRTFMQWIDLLATQDEVSIYFDQRWIHPSEEVVK